jgi:soluble lytic murein transglycosylase
MCRCRKDLTDGVECVISPYDEIMQSVEIESGIDWRLLSAIAHTESNFRADAVSKRGAVGLMQIMPDTGSWIAEKLNLENFTKEDLLDCEKNIMMGVWYLDYLLGRFDYNIETTIAAYNAGPTIVSKWLNDESLSIDGENLTNIPFDETKKYREKVSNAYSMYLKLYEGAQI